LIVGIKESAVLNNVFTFVNLSVIALVVIVGLTKINGHNWKISPDEVNEYFYRKLFFYFEINLDTKFN
jgi:amino acid transporter